MAGASDGQFVLSVAAPVVDKGYTVKFFAISEVAEWCQQHGVALDEQWRLADDWHPAPQPAYHARVVYGWDGRSGREPRLAAAVTTALGGWEECLLWVTQWGVWPNGEDWPRYYEMRGIRHEKRSLDEAPGRLFPSDEADVLAEFLTVVMEDGWDAFVLSASASASVSVGAFTSHDGWFDAYTPLAIAG